MSNTYKTLASKLKTVLNMNLSDNSTETILELICKEQLSIPASTLGHKQLLQKLNHLEVIVADLRKKNSELTTLLDSVTKPDTSELEEIDKAAAENFHPKTGMPLDSDEIPYLECRSPLLRKVGCALQKNEVWQVRRYIQSGRSPAWICDKMKIGESTVSGIKHNKTYAGVPLEHPKEHKHTGPVTVHAGYGVEKQSGKKN